MLKHPVKKKACYPAFVSAIVPLRTSLWTASTLRVLGLSCCRWLRYAIKDVNGFLRKPTSLKIVLCPDRLYLKRNELNVLAQSHKQSKLLQNIRKTHNVLHLSPLYFKKVLGARPVSLMTLAILLTGPGKLLSPPAFNHTCMGSRGYNMVHLLDQRKPCENLRC